MICPQSAGNGDGGDDDAPQRLAHTLKELQDAGFDAIGQVVHPDPYTAIQNALQFYAPGRHRHIDLPRDALGLAARRPDRPRAGLHREARGARRERYRREPDGVGVGSRWHAATSTSITGRPRGQRSSRVEAQFLGMLLFIISEIMLFGAFFTAYFFIRVVDDGGWFPLDGKDLPVAIAGVNTRDPASPPASRCTGRSRAPATGTGAPSGGPAHHRRCWASRSSAIQINEYVHIGFAPHDNAQGSIFYGLTGLHGAHVFVGLTLLTFATVRAFRGHFTEKEHRGVEVPGIYWHFVDVMWIFVYSTLYVL